MTTTSVATSAHEPAYSTATPRRRRCISQCGDVSLAHERRGTYDDYHQRRLYATGNLTCGAVRRRPCRGLLCRGTGDEALLARTQSPRPHSSGGARFYLLGIYCYFFFYASMQYLEIRSTDAGPLNS
jgi:hypothetical protein